MKLPRLDQASVPRRKITKYLLSSTHPEGSAKAGFFKLVGFRLDRWEQLAEALRVHAADHDVVQTESSPFGTRYVIEGIIRTPSGRRPVLRSVWFIDSGGGTPRFVTAYPVKEKTP